MSMNGKGHAGWMLPVKAGELWDLNCEPGEPQRVRVLEVVRDPMDLPDVDLIVNRTATIWNEVTRDVQTVPVTRLLLCKTPTDAADLKFLNQLNQTTLNDYKASDWWIKELRLYSQNGVSSPDTPKAAVTAARFTTLAFQQLEDNVVRVGTPVMIDVSADEGPEQVIWADITDANFLQNGCLKATETQRSFGTFAWLQKESVDRVVNHEYTSSSKSLTDKTKFLAWYKSFLTEFATFPRYAEVFTEEHIKQLLWLSTSDTFCHIFDAYQAGLAATDKPLADAGPWFVMEVDEGTGINPDDKFYAIASEDFTHDVLMKIQGDFGSNTTRRNYAIRMAAILNQKCGL